MKLTCTNEPEIQTDMFDARYDINVKELHGESTRITRVRDGSLVPTIPGLKSD